jgi:hypothetical protein
MSAWTRYGRRCLGGFYLAMAWGVNAFVTLPDAGDAMRGFAADSWLPPYRAVLEAVVVPNAVPVTLATIAFETAAGVAMLAPSARVARFGVLAGAAWCTGLLPALAWPYIAAMPPLIAVQLWLFWALRREERSRSSRSRHETDRQNGMRQRIPQR